MPDHLQKLKAVLDLIKESITRKEFLASFNAVIKQVLKLEKDMLARHEELMAGMRGELKMDFEEVVAGLKMTFEQYKKQYKEALEMARSVLNEQKQEHAALAQSLIKTVQETISKVKDGVDGKNPSREELIKVIEELLPEAIPPETPEQIRDKLESLQDENRLSIAAIHGLEEKLDALEKRPVGGKGGGGFSKGHMDIHIVDDETLSGAINGVNAVFTIANTPNPSGSLKVYVNGQRLRVTDDYTISNRTITLSTAPPVGAVLLADYRI